MKIGQSAAAAMLSVLLCAPALAQESDTPVTLTNCDGTASLVLPEGWAGSFKPLTWGGVFDVAPESVADDQPRVRLMVLDRRNFVQSSLDGAADETISAEALVAQSAADATSQPAGQLTSLQYSTFFPLEMLAGEQDGGYVEIQASDDRTYTTYVTTSRTAIGQATVSHADIPYLAENRADFEALFATWRLPDSTVTGTYTQYTLDCDMRFTFPDHWQAEDLQHGIALYPDAEPYSLGTRIRVFGPEALGMWMIRTGAANGTAEAVADFILANGGWIAPEATEDLEYITVAGYPALRIMLRDDGLNPTDGLVLVIEVARGTYAAVLADTPAGDLAAREADILALAESIEYLP